jgi:hypothetical protein
LELPDPLTRIRGGWGSQFRRGDIHCGALSIYVLCNLGIMYFCGLSGKFFHGPGKKWSTHFCVFITWVGPGSWEAAAMAT